MMDWIYSVIKSDSKCFDVPDEDKFQEEVENPTKYSSDKEKCGKICYFFTKC